jgi:hypothetical protein
LTVVLDTTVGSDISRVESKDSARLVAQLATGTVSGRAYVAMRFSSVTPRRHSERYRIQTRNVGRLAPPTKEKDAVTIGAPA